jgi:integrase
MTNDPLERNDVEEKVQSYMHELIDEGYKAGTAKQVYKSVRFFLKACGLKFELDREDKPRDVGEQTRLATTDDILEMWEFMGAEMRERNRALLMLLKDSGLRVSDAVNLDVEDWLKAENRESEYGRFKVFLPKATQKTKEMSHVILGEESIDAVEKYLGARDSGPLFLTRAEPIADETAEETEKARKWHNKRNIVGYKDAARLKAGTGSEVFLRLKKHLSRPHKKSAHSLRYFQFNRLKASGMDTDWIHYLQGKKYFKNYTQAGATIEEIIQAYMKSYEKLRVFGTPQDQRVETMEEEIKNLRKEASKDLSAKFRVFNKGVEEQLERERETTKRLIEAARERDLSSMLDAFSRTLDSVVGDDPRTRTRIEKRFQEEIKKQQGKEIKKET